MSAIEERDDRLGSKRAHPARLYDFFLGGKTNYPVDRAAALQTLRVNPATMTAARENRAFMRRATRYVAQNLGVRQFLDVGTGIPTEPNLHQVAQSIRPHARIVYTDNDPIVLTYARALLASNAQGSTDHVDADVRDPQTILQRAAASLDFTEPICLSVIALFHFVPDEERPYDLIEQLMRALPAGSVLTLSNATKDFDSGEIGPMARLSTTYYDNGMTMRLRSEAETADFFTRAGLKLVEPGLVPVSEWHPEWERGGMKPLAGTVSREEAAQWAGVGVKP